MPQMSPLNWMMLFIMFFMTYLLFMILNYFNKSFLKTSNIKNEFISTKSLNWKW